MATFFHGAPEIQSDSLQTLYLMNPGYVGYSDASAPSNMFLLNSTINSLNPMSLSQSEHQPSHQQHFVGIPLQATATAAAAVAVRSQDANHDVSAMQGLVPRLHYNLWTPAPSSNTIDMPPQLGPHRPSAVPLAQQGLSLSLSPQQAPYNYHPEPEVPTPVPEIAPVTDEEVRLSGATTSVTVAGSDMSGLQSMLMGSKYLKISQELLDEVVNVSKGVKDEATAKAAGGTKSPVRSNPEPETTGEGETSMKRGSDLTTAERQELQMKKAKLVSMLDEVEQRYRQYHHQMQIVVSSFEAVAGPGSAKTYTALALQTISKQFRCLRDAISGQIRATSRNLGEEESKSEGGSRLRFVDHQLRQQRALQQLGMMQHNAWRPQRGLPERSVSVLRAWLFEHFLHPYPKDSDKLMLAKQTGLTRSQVSNWFINARVRIWKPMVEEMYMEEHKEQEQNNNSDDKASKSEDNEGSPTKTVARQENSPIRTDKTNSRDKPPPPITMHRPSLESVISAATMQPKFKKARGDELLNAEMKPADTSNQDGTYTLIAGSESHGGGFGAYQVAEFGRLEADQFAPRFAGNGVALTLGLPHCDNISLSGAQPSYLSSEMSTEASGYYNFSNNSSSNQTGAHTSNAYENINIQSRKRFAVQLLPDFVA